jgi:nucleoside-diphosphate-sugar epimerase
MNTTDTAPQPAAETREDFSPSRYLTRVHRRTGEEIPGPIDPDELLIATHRDTHPLEMIVQFLASRAVKLSGSEAIARQGLRTLNTLGTLVAQAVGTAVGSKEVEKQAKKLLGVIERDYVFQFRQSSHLSEQEVTTRIATLQQQARAALKARGRSPKLRVLLTGATGFLGKEILFQVAEDSRIGELVAVLRPETIRNPKTKEIEKILSPQERGALLLERLHIPKARRKKFRFIAGDIEQPNLGIAAEEFAHLCHTLTHVIHCAASVSFEDPYKASYRANVLGCRNALTFSLALQETSGSPFVSHIAIETSYIHGRKRHTIAQESALEFPRHFYNNFYELTKAMASMETDRFLIEKGLRVAQLLPSIVIGHSRSGNNRGDTKVVNAPINAFGRVQQALDQAGGISEQLKTWLVSKLASNFPGDPTAELNLVPVDRVAAGIVAALTAPNAIGQRIHLATDNRIRSEDMLRINREELGVAVRLADPTIYRNLTLPVVKSILLALNEPRLADGLERLGTIFGGYSEWGQLIHSVGNDVRILGLPIRRPNTEQAFRMLCRHNKYVQHFGRIRDADEIARREQVWEQACAAIEQKSGHEAGALSPEEFRRLLAEEVNFLTFRLRSGPHPSVRKPKQKTTPGGTVA